MNLRKLTVTVMLLSGCFGLLTWAGAGESRMCTGDNPASVLGCYASAFAQRDSSAYAALLAPDYVYADRSHPENAGFDWAGVLQMVGKLFNAAHTESIRLEMGEPRAIEPGQAEGTWVLRDVPTLLHLEGTSQDGRPGPFEVKKVTALWVRAVGDPEPHFVIFREEVRDPEGE